MLKRSFHAACQPYGRQWRTQQRVASHKIAAKEQQRIKSGQLSEVCADHSRMIKGADKSDT